MKKKIVLAMAVIMVLGSVKAMAEDYHSINMEGKLQATEADAAERDDFQMGFNQDKWDAAELDSNLMTINSKIQELEKLQDELSDMENTNGLLSAIGQTVTTATEIQKEIAKSSDLKKSRQLIQELNSEINNFKNQHPSYNIRGIKKHDELTY
nr:hypothetical protein BdHM001_03840 [Bdellovibrio sp. HM001]BFD65514.1 hypothetical protein HAGR004_05360 [Bdellovibrio sp. HAGR004]